MPSTTRDPTGVHGGRCHPPRRGSPASVAARVVVTAVPDVPACTPQVRPRSRSNACCRRQSARRGPRAVRGLPITCSDHRARVTRRRRRAHLHPLGPARQSTVLIGPARQSTVAAAAVALDVAARARLARLLARAAIAFEVARRAAIAQRAAVSAVTFRVARCASLALHHAGAAIAFDVAARTALADECAVALVAVEAARAARAADLRSADTDARRRRRRHDVRIHGLLDR